MKKGLYFLVIIFLFVTLFSYSKIENDQRKVMDQQWININECGMAISNFGVIGANLATGNCGFYYPAGYTNETYIFGAGMWFGCLIDTFELLGWGLDTIWLSDTLVSAGFEPGDGISEFVPGDVIDSLPDYPTPYDNPWDIVYLSASENNGYQWPVRTKFGQDSIVSDEDSYCEINDKDPSSHFFTSSHPLFIEVHQTTYCWNSERNKNIVYIKYDIRNDRPDRKTLRQCYFAMHTDNDIGNESGDVANDLLGFIDTITIGENKERINLAYQFQLNDEPGWLNTPAIICWKYLETIKAKEPLDLYHDGSYIISPHHEIGMTSLQNFKISNYPSTIPEKYQFLAGYNISAFNPDNPELSFEPFPNWGDGVTGFPGQSMPDSLAADKSFMISSGPFDLEYGETATIVMAIIMAPTKEDIIPMAISAQDVYDSEWALGVNEEKPKTVKKSEVPKICLTSDYLSVEAFNSGEVKLFNTAGRLVSSSRMISSQGKYSCRMNVSHLPNGIYFLDIKTAESDYTKKIVLIK